MGVLKARSCSIQCYRDHQTTHTTVRILSVKSNSLPPKPPPLAAFATKSNLIQSHGSSLRNNPPISLEAAVELEKLYSRYPRLQEQLRDIYEVATERPPDNLDDQSSMSNRAEQGGSQGWGRGRGRAKEASIPWSRKRGFKAGLNRLKSLRHLKGTDGEGLCEFSQFVATRIDSERSAAIDS